MTREAEVDDRSESSGRDALVVQMAEDFSARHRRGEKPTLEEYVALHPELEAQIRELFPMLCVLEELGPESPGREAPQGPADSRDRKHPKQLGEYRIIREIGRGGMGVVYEAEQETLKRRVALKVLPFQSFQDGQQLERFRREAQAAARLHHTNIVPVFGVGEDEGIQYYVMQFIRGQTLAQVLDEVRRLRASQNVQRAATQEGDVSAAAVARSLTSGTAGAPPADPGPRPLPDAEAAVSADDSSTSLSADSPGLYFLSVARIAQQVAEALAYAHNEGILHRDIKPSNLLLDLRGTVWITDFGLAKVEGSGELTISGSLVGTIRYMAPERFRGQGDPRSDVYSLGITLYELLTLRPAFAASDRAEVMHDVTTREPPPPRRIDPGIPRDIETVVLKAIAKKPDDRYQSAAGFAEDLRRFLHHEPVSARRASPPERLWRWTQRNPALATSTGLIALLLVALATGGMISAARQRAAFGEAQARLVQSRLEEGRAWRLSREPGGRARSLAALREAVTPETAQRVRSELIGALALVDLEEIYRRKEANDRTQSDETLARYATPDADGAILVYDDVEAQTPIARLPGIGAPVRHLTLGPGGRLIAADCLGPMDRTSDVLVLWDVERRERLFEAAIPPDANRVAFDSSGGRFAYFDRSGTVVVRALPGGQEARPLEKTGFPSRIRFSPEGERLALAGLGYNLSCVRILDIQTGKVIQQLNHPNSTYGLSWHPRGRRLAVGCHDFKVHLWDVETGTRLFSLGGHSAEVVSVVFSHSGRYLASAGWDNRTLLWEADTGQLLAEARGAATAFSLDDRRLAFDESSQSANLWRVGGGDFYRTLGVPMVGKGPRDVALSGDGRWLAAAASVIGVRLWSLTAPGDPYQLRAGEVWGVRFEPNGAGLWIAAEEGLFHCPISQEGDSRAVSVGPLERIAAEVTKHVSLARNGRRIATVTQALGRQQVVVRDLDRGAEVLGIWGHPGATRCDLSASGRWVVSTTFQGEDVKAWDVTGGSLACSFPVGTATAAYSPDERWLAISWESWIALYEAGKWTERFRVKKDSADLLSNAAQFTADSRFLAASLSRSMIALLRVEDGSEVARFEAPNSGTQVHALCMDDGQTCLVAASSTHEVSLWDLRGLRLELRSLGLDWNPSEPLQARPRALPLSIRLDSGAWKDGMPSGREVSLQKNRALDLHSRRIELDPSPEAYSDRAAAFEQVGDWTSALPDLDRVLLAQPDDFDALARRAVVHASLGHKDQAEQDGDRAIQACREALADPSADRSRARSSLITVLRGRARAGSVAGLSEVEETWSLWKEVLELKPGDLEASALLSWLWLVRRCAASSEGNGPDEDARLALDCAERTHREHPEEAVYSRDLGAILCHLGRFGEARPLLEEAWRKNQQLHSALLYLALVEEGQGHPAEARQRFEEAVQGARKRLPEGAPIREVFESLASFAQRRLK